MLSHWKQEGHFLKPETLFKNRLKSIEPARREEERDRDRETERQRDRERQRQRLFCFPLSRLQRNKWIGLCKVCHPNDAYLWQVILLGKEFVLLCKMIGKQQKMSSRRSAYKV